MNRNLSAAAVLGLVFLLPLGPALLLALVPLWAGAVIPGRIGLLVIYGYASGVWCVCLTLCWLSRAWSPARRN